MAFLSALIYLTFRPFSVGETGLSWGRDLDPRLDL